MKAKPVQNRKTIQNLEPVGNLASASPKSTYLESVRVLKPADFRILPWKNGQGSTTEMLISPTHSDFTRDNFNFRVSSASITQSGDFSSFPGYQRILAVIGGDLLTLHVGADGKRAELREGDFVQFSGDVRARAEVGNRHIIDFNFIFKRGLAVTFTSLSPNDFPFTISNERQHIVFPWRGQCHLGRNQTLPEGHLAIIPTRSGVIELLAADENCSVFVVTLGGEVCE